MPVTFETEAPPKKSGVVFDPPPAGQLSDPTQVQPTAEQRLRDKEAVEGRVAIRRAREKFIKENVQPDIPLDIDAELPSLLRSRVSFEGNIDKQADLVARQPGVLNARKSKDGTNIIVQIPSEDGRSKEILLHPKNSSIRAGDFAGATAPILKTGGAAALGVATAPVSLPLAGAATFAGTALMEAGLTGGSRLEAGQDIDLPELTSRSVKEGAINAALPLVGAAGQATLRGGRALLAARPGALAKNVVAASERTGVPVFPSQTLDSTTLARAEEFAGLSGLKREQQGALSASFDRRLGPSGGAGVLSEADIAKKVQPALAAEAEAAERGARITMTDAERAAQRQLKAELDSGLVPAGASNSTVGQHTRTKFEEFVEAAQKKAAIDYPKFHSQAAKEGIELNPKPISDLVAKIEKEDPAGVAEFLAPSVRQVKSVEQRLTKPLSEAQPSGILDDRGRPIMMPEVPAPPLTFEEAIRQRAIVRQKLNAPDDPMGDVVKSYYKQLEKAYSDVIDDGLKRGSPELRALYDEARGGYRGAAEVLDRGVVQRLFREPGEAGRVPDESVVTQLFTGTGKVEALRDMKKILGADSADFKLLIRQGVQNMIDDAAQKGSGGLIDVDAFLTRFNRLSNEMRAEMFGPMEGSLKAAADAMSIAQKGASKVARIPTDELQDALLAAPKDAKRLIEQAVQRQKAYETEYTNSIMQKLTGRDLGIRDLGNIDRFVSDFVPAASAADMRQILTKIEAARPGASGEIRNRVLANIRRDVAADAPVGVKTTGESFDLNPDKIRKYTSGPDAEKYRAVLGNSVMQFLDDMATIAESNLKRVEMGSKENITPRVFGKEAISGAAGFVRNAISTGVDIASIVPRAILGNAERSAAVRRFLQTGEWPPLSTKGRIVRGAVLAAPEAEQARESVLAEKP